MADNMSASGQTAGRVHECASPCLPSTAVTAAAQREGSGFREQFDRTPFTFDSIQNHSFQKNTQPLLIKNFETFQPKQEQPRRHVLTCPRQWPQCFDTNLWTKVVDFLTNRADFRTKPSPLCPDYSLNVWSCLTHRCGRICGDPTREQNSVEQWKLNKFILPNKSTE